MDEAEILVTIGAGYCTYKFLKMWYPPLWGAWLPGRGKLGKAVLNVLPLLLLCIMWYTLTNLAASDVVSAPHYIFMYVLIGCAWLLLGELCMAMFFDLSWRDDALYQNNPAALLAMVGGMLGLTVVYSAANIGEGPGWWCVIIAGGLGLAAWIALGMAVSALTRGFERVTVDRDVGAGIRLGFYLLASGILLGRACAGNWTSLSGTLIEFLDGWPVLILMALAALVERGVMRMQRGDGGGAKRFVFASVLCGLLYVTYAVLSVTVLLPLPGWR